MDLPKTIDATSALVALDRALELMGLAVADQAAVLDLLRRSRLHFTATAETSHAIAWAATLRIDDYACEVENLGEGGPNTYHGPSQSCLAEAQLRHLVVSAIPELAARAALDEFCTLVELFDMVLTDLG